MVDLAEPGSTVSAFNLSARARLRADPSLMVCPDLLEHIRKEVERGAAQAKNLRKAREEKEALKKGKKDDKT